MDQQAYQRAQDAVTALHGEVVRLRVALEQIERLGREGTLDGHLIRCAMVDVAHAALNPRADHG